MTRAQLIRTRQKLVDNLPITGEVLRGSLFERITRHTSGCQKCASGGGHALWVLTVGYERGNTRQFSLRPEQVPEARRLLRNYQKLKESIEAICELNQQLLRLDRAASKRRKKTRD